VLKTEMLPWDGPRRVRVARLGSGPPLVLLHGYPDNLQVFAELAPRLADRSEVIALDWPGLGYSDPVGGGATPAHLADRLKAILDAWKIDRASVLGLDMGGQPALAFAARHPDRIDRLVVTNSLVMPDADTSWEIRILRKFGWNRVILRRLPWLVFRRAVRTFLPPGVHLPDDLRADLWEAFRKPEVRKFLSKMCAGYQGTLPRLPEEYRRVRCPTLILWGEADRHFPPVHARGLHALIPHAGCEVIPGAGHWMVWDRAEEVAARVRAFLVRPGE
jgi:pimeloyl-ACP methyl ester carboxylesterase